MTRILEVNHLRTYFYPPLSKTVPAVDDVSFYIDEGETLCMVGESGCGKSVTSLSIMRLVSTPPGKYVSGEILLKGDDILKKTAGEMREIRGNRISMIYQEPMTSLNPVFTIGMQIMEPLLIHRKISRREAREKAIEMISLVGIPHPERIMEEYPHQLSGGMRQRIMIAMGLICEPELLIADEPTTALDVTIQAQILDLMRNLKQNLSMTTLFITHDLGVVAEMADRVAVMYAGKIVEYGTAKDIFRSPQHPYTQGLLKCIPKFEQNRTGLQTIKGTVPAPTDFPEGCRFHPRCSFATELCRASTPELRETGSTTVACHRISLATV